jgi:Phosphatidylinositol 3- and 4-kinase
LLLSYIATFETLKEKENSKLKLTHALERLYSALRQLESQLASECERNGLTCNKYSEAECHSHHGTPDLLEISKSTESASNDTKSSHSSSVRKPTLLLKIFKKSKNSAKTKHGSLARHDEGNGIVPTNDKLSSIALPAAGISSSPKPMDLKERLATFSYFLKDLDDICDAIERSLLKSISQKIADWALQPWSASKESELGKVTDDMRKGLKNIMASSQTPLRIINPIETQERLISIDSDESYILPSAHFPLLLTFDAQVVKNGERMDLSYQGSPFKSEFIYKTTIEILSIHEINSPSQISQGEAYCVQAAVAGVVQESAKSSPSGNQAHQWATGGNLTFLTRSCWGPPQTLSLGVSRTSVNGNSIEALQSVGHCWVDMKSMWETIVAKDSLSTPYTEDFSVKAWSLELTESFDSNGNISGEMFPAPGNLEIELRITNQQIGLGKHMNGSLTRKRMLLYKHDDDLRQEMFTIQLINLCDSLLKQAGLDMKLITFRCIPVGCKRGFIEWIPGSVPLSDICQSCPGSIFARSCSEESVVRKSEVLVEVRDPLSEVAKAGLLNYQSLPHSPTKPKTLTCGEYTENSLVNNPIQDFFRSTAYDPNAPFFIQKKVMDTYIKSCAGYSVITYILGIGDRHLDNLLLHQNGYLFHCDYSFILGKDPKKYLPLRITEQMIHGMGGRESDNFSRFLSLAGATFVALRRHENARLILAMARLMTPSILPDICLNQKPEQAIDGIHERLRLDLSDEDAITYIERIIEESASSKLWVAVDALHVIGKRF